MPPKGHAILSASSSERWLNCPPSARLCEAYEDKGSDYAAEGTDAHALCEFRLKQALGMPTEDPIENLSWYNEEMEECAAGYAAYVVELLETAKQTCSDPVVMIEQRVNFTRWVQDGFGTADCLLIADGTLNVIDMKFGRGIEVSAIKNPQMMLYALGALEIFDGIYDIDTVRMTIYQPRKSNVSVYELPKADLLEWADTELTQKAKLAFEGQGDFHCGEWCRFCKAKAECRERAIYNLRLAQYEFLNPALLHDEEIADILGRIDALTAWASDVKEYALQQAISGKEWTGWKLVEGRSNRKYTSEAAVATAVEGIGFDPYERKVLGITAMQKLLGKSRFEELLSPYIEKPQGKPTLVPESDKRPAMNTAKNDFMEEFYKRFLGYEKGEDGRPAVVESEASVVKLIYGLFLEGKTQAGICKYLEEFGIPSPGGKQTWSKTTVTSILRNEKYKGDALLQKKFTVDFLEKKMKPNEGEVPQYYVTGSHPAIIEPDEWEQVQAEFARRKTLGKAYSGKSVLSAKLVCEDCGAFFGPKVWHSTDQYRRTIWQCNGKFAIEEHCHTPALDTETIKRLFIKAYNLMMQDRVQIIKECEEWRQKLMDFGTLDADIERQLEETQVVAELVKAAVKENASTAQSQEAYLKKYEALTERYEKAAAELERLQSLRTARSQQDKKIALYIRTLKKQPEVMHDWNETIWTVMIEKAIVHKDGQITFIFQNGTEIKVGA